ncbi:MAG: hypothetical protein Q9179_000282 [Wetmoreana sp. 5 TL-2023]
MRSSLCGSTQGLPTQKLSKPPTNSSSSNLLAAARQEPEPGSPLVPSDADSGDGYFPSMAQASRRRQNTRSKIRSYLYGPGQEAGQFHSSEDEDNSPGKLANVARDVRRRLSRTDSSALPTSSVEASVASSTSRPYTADHLGPDLDEDEVMKEQIKEKVWTDMLAAQNHVSSPIDEDKHPDSVKSPIRRRSLYTPGIATRSPEDILRKPPPPEHLTSQATQDYYYNPARPESSPLSRLANLRSSYTGRSTPSELDYTHLGALKLGTLRVTNGAASPIPRDQDISPVLALGLETTSQDDYYTASEGGRSEEDGRLDRLSGNMSHPLRVASTDVIAPFSEISPSSAVRSFQSGSTVDMSANSPGPGICGQNTDELGSPASVGSITPNIRSIKRKPLPSTAAARQAAQNRCTTTGDVLEIPASPCSLRWSAHHGQNKPMNQQQAGETTGSEVTAPPKRQERNSDLWRSFIQSAEQCHADSGSREDALLALTRNQSYREEYGGASEKVREQLIAFPRDKDSKQLDSGYSSNISLGSNETSLSEKSRTIASSTSPQHMRSPAPHPPETSFEPDLSDIFTNDNVFGARETPRLPCGLDTDVQTNLITDTAARSSFTADRNPAAVVQSQQEISNPGKSRKLQKRRPKSQPPVSRTPTATSHNLSQHDIPPLPNAVADRHSERASRFPVLDHTYSNLHLTNDDISLNPTLESAAARFPSPTHETEVSPARDRPSLFQRLASRARSRSRSRPRKAQLSYESDDESVKSEICRSPSWSDYGNKKKKEQKRKEKAEQEREKQRKRDPSTEPNPRSRSKSRSRFRSRSQRRSPQPECAPTIAGLGTVRECLGASPLDIAKASLEVETQRAGPLIQPHYMSTGQPCAGIRDPILMDDVERIRQRSQSLAGHTLPVNEDIEDRKNIPQKPARPHSMYFGAPPIPALPVAKVTQSISGSQTNSAAPRASRYYQEPAVVASAPVSQAVYQTQIHPDGEAMEKSSCTAAGALAADDSVSIEELIDRLLDAPDHEAREIVLQQIRQHRRKAPAGSNDACQRISEAQKSHPFHTAVGMVKRENLPVKPSPINHSRTEAGKPKVAANKNARPQTMFVSAPPMPPLPSAERLQQQEAQKSASKFVRSKTLTPPQSHSPEVSKKDLWAGCAIQTEHKKAIESHTDWSPHRLAWSHRRKSAGEALLRTDQPFGQVDDTSHASGHADTLGETASPPSRAMTAGSENLSVPKAGNRAFHKPWASVQGQQISPAPSESPVQPSSKIAAPAQAFERLTGRFEGGLMYGYEPGFGLGGSAGTRSVKTGATRKSVQMSQGYGVDLSDVPIFVAPSN